MKEDNVRKSILLGKMNYYAENPISKSRSVNRRQSEPSRTRFIFCLLISSLFYLTAATNTASAATYYVDAANGDDSHSKVQAQNIGTPWQTIDHGASQLSPGDILLVRGGTYRETVAIGVSGTAENRITVKNYPGEEPIIDGSEIMTDWTNCESQEACGGNKNWQNIYYAYAPAATELFTANLYQNDEILSISQYPDPEDPLYMDDFSGYITISASDITSTTIVDSRLAALGGADLVGAYVAIRCNPNAVIYREITDYNSVDTKITFVTMGGYTPFPNSDTPYSLLNSLEDTILDAEGEYYFNETPEGNGTHKIYLWPLNDQDLSAEGEVTVSLRTDVFDLLHSDYVTLDGFKFQKVIGVVIKTGPGAAYTGHQIRNMEITKCRTDVTKDLIWIRNTADAIIEDNYLHRNVGSLRGVTLSAGSNAIVRDNHFEYMGRTNIFYQGVDGGQIVGNTINDSTGTHGNGISVYQSSSDILIAGNTVTNSNIAFSMQASSNLTIYNNILHGSDTVTVVLADFTGMTGYVNILNNIILGSTSDTPVSLYGSANNVFINNITDGKVDDDVQVHSNNIVINTLNEDSIDMTDIFVNSPAVEGQTFDVPKMVLEGTNINTTVLYMKEYLHKNIKENYYLIYTEDPTPRVITSDGERVVYKGNWRAKVSFTPAIGELKEGKIEIWKSVNNLELDLHPKPGGLSIDNGTDVTGYLPITDFPDFDFGLDIEGNQRSQGAGFDASCYEYGSSDPNNQAPVLQEIGNKSVNENSALAFDVNATDADSDTITYSATGLPTGATFTGQTFSWMPGYTQAGTYQVTFTASDGTDQDSETITITVSNTNRAPVLAAVGNQSVNEGSTLSFSISATDADGDTITYSVQSLPSGAVFASQTFTWTPGYTQAGTHQVTFTASDSQAQDSETITITVNNVNRAPVLDSIGDKSVFTGNSLTFTISATDADSDTITYSATNLPSGATFSGQNFSWTPGSSQAGSYDVTFTASDSQTQDSETITITVTADTAAPTVSNLSPAADSIQAPLNSLIYLDVTDSGKGVNASTVTIEVNSNLIYTGDTTDYSSSYGRCRRIGTSAAYKYIYQADETFDYGQTVTVTVNATDLAANPMDEYSYSFKTEMRSFGENKKVNSSSNNLNDSSPATASDSSGNIWVVWHTGQTGSRDIYIGKLTAGADSFGSSVRVTNNNTDQCNPVIAIDSTDKLYVAWQDSRNGEWDIYLSTSTDGTNFSTERKITDPNSNQINPAIVIDSSDKAYIVWEDDRNNNKDIYIASSSNSFVSYATSQITSNASDQIAPAIAVDSGNTVYVVWTDARGGTSDIYGADSDNGPWTNAAVVSNANNQSSPAIATEASGTILHLLWVDDTSGDNDIYYASSNGLPGSSLTGSSLIDDNSGASQSAPAITVTGSTGNNLKLFACWEDERNVSNGNGDTDIYLVEVNSDSGTNVLVGDDSTNSAQNYPAIGIDGYEYPYLVWTDGRNTSTDIYYAGSTFVESTALESEDVTASSGVTVGTELANINSTTDVSVIIPVGASSHDATIIISRVKNPQKLTLDRFSIPYEFGPSGIEFDQPVTIIIPYDVSTVGNSPSAYWYNPLTDLLSQQGITDVETIEISSTLHALRFKTTHFTQFLVGAGIAAAAVGGAGGGGCSMSPNGQGNIVEFLLPYIGLIVVMTILKLRDRQKKNVHNITGSG